MGQVSLKEEGEAETHIHREKSTHGRGKMGVLCNLRTEALGEIKPADPLPLHFRPPEL